MSTPRPQSNKSKFERLSMSVKPGNRDQQDAEVIIEVSDTRSIKSHSLQSRKGHETVPEQTEEKTFDEPE